MVAAVAALPIVGSIATATGLAATTIASVGLYVATTAASYFLQQALAPGAPKQEFGTKLNTVLGGAVKQAIIFGGKESAGSFIYKGTWGNSGEVPNAFLVKVYAISDLPANDFTATLWAGGRKCAIDTGTTSTVGGQDVGHPVPAFNQGGNHRLWVKFHDGSQTVADAYLRDKFGSHPTRPWTADMIGRGRAYVIVTQKYDKKEPAGEVDPLFVAQGAKFYDWREDSTNGGSGTHRYGTYSTYEYNSYNPIVTIYNIMRGIYWGDEWLYGGQQWPAGRLDNDSFTAAANVCDEDVTLAGGGTQKRYRVGGEIDLSEEPWTVIERLLKACNGRIVESGGVFKVYAGGIGAAVSSVTDDDLLVSEELTGKFFPGRDAIANTIVGSYVEPDNAGEAKAYKSRTNAGYLAEDGDEVRKTSFDLDYVRQNQQAQRLAKLALNDNRRFREFVVAFWTSARKLEPCDVVNWTSTRFGFTNKKFICGDVTLRDDGVAIVNLREADASDADWSTSDEDAYDVGIFDEDVTPTQALAFTVAAAAVTDDDGSNRRPAIRIQATLTDDFVDCKALLWEVRKKNGDNAVIADGRSEAFFDPASPRFGDVTVSRNGFLPNKQVQVRAKIEPESDRDTDWSDWADVSIYPGGLTYLTLTNARLKIATPSADNDIDMVLTGNVDTRQIWASASFNFSKANQTAPYSDSDIGSVSIDNPNRTPVFIDFVFKLDAATTAGKATHKIELIGGGEVLQSITVSATNNSGDATLKRSTRSAKISVIDANWSAGDNIGRTYKVTGKLTKTGANCIGRVFPGKATLAWGKR